MTDPRLRGLLEAIDAILIRACPLRLRPARRPDAQAPGQAAMFGQIGDAP